VRALAVFSPIHYQELPEAFMDLIASLTGKSPSTTGAGSEGALTKGPFNALPPIYDLNAALVSFLITDLPAFSTAAGWVGPKLRVDHDVSLLVPEIWCRMTRQERDPKFLIAEGYLERCSDWVHDGKPVLASRLGYRITERFVRTFFGRVLSNPSTVFDEELLRPELQDAAIFADGMDNIVAAMKAAAENYFADGSVEQACPPLNALLHIMRDGTWQGHGPDAAEFRRLFDREEMLKSDWYQARLEAKRQIDAASWETHARYLEKFIRRANYSDVALQLDIKGRLERVIAKARTTRDPAYTKELVGTLGGEPAVASAIVKACKAKS
jgi:phosphoenolpyruvate carboxykinase (diphosphate)